MLYFRHDARNVGRGLDLRDYNAMPHRLHSLNQRGAQNSRLLLSGRTAWTKRTMPASHARKTEPRGPAAASPVGSGIYTIPIRPMRGRPASCLLRACWVFLCGYRERARTRTFSFLSMSCEPRTWLKPVDLSQCDHKVEYFYSLRLLSTRAWLHLGSSIKARSDITGVPRTPQNEIWRVDTLSWTRTCPSMGSVRRGQSKVCWEPRK